MSKGLEALERIKDNLAEFVSDDYHYEDYVNDVNLIEKELKALATIKRYAKDIELYHDLCCLVDDDEDLKIVDEVLHG